jgi:hypothetical protein
VSSQVDLIYDRFIAPEKLKDGTKYERLAAIAFASSPDKPLSTTYDCAAPPA